MVRGSSCALSDQRDALYRASKEFMEAKQSGESVMNPSVSLHTVDAHCSMVSRSTNPGLGYLSPKSGCFSLVDDCGIFCIVQWVNREL